LTKVLEAARGARQCYATAFYGKAHLGDINADGSWEAVSNPDLMIEGGAAVVTVPAASAQIVHLQ